MTLFLGFYEMQPGSGVWYRVGTKGGSRELRVCERTTCSKKFMGDRTKGRGRFCSRACANYYLRHKPDVLYGSLHDRVEAARGKATEYSCVDCGGQAEEWSRIHDRDGKSVWDYEPRCVRHHQAYDIESCPRGESQGAAKLTVERVRGIKSSIGATGVELARIHNVSPNVISRIRRQETWKHVN